MTPTLSEPAADLDAEMAEYQVIITKLEDSIRHVMLEFERDMHLEAGVRTGRLFRDLGKIFEFYRPSIFPSAPPARAPPPLPHTESSQPSSSLPSHSTCRHTHKKRHSPRCHIPHQPIRTNSCE